MILFCFIFLIPFFISLLFLIFFLFLLFFFFISLDLKKKKSQIKRKRNRIKQKEEHSLIGRIVVSKTLGRCSSHLALDPFLFITYFFYKIKKKIKSNKKKI